MKYTVSLAVQEQADKCQKKHQCLTSGIFGKQTQCQATDMNGPNVIFLKYIAQVPCSYRINFGKGQLCTCPVRYAIYQQHGVESK